MGGWIRRRKREGERKIGGLAGGGYRVDGWADGGGKEGVGRLDQWRERGSSWSVGLVQRERGRICGSCTQRERERERERLID